MDTLLILTKGDWTTNVQKVEPTLNKLKGRGLICNIKKSFFGKLKWNI